MTSPSISSSELEQLKNSGAGDAQAAGKISVPKTESTDQETENQSSTPSAGLSRHSSGSKLNCLCSPTTHAGSFRCRRHRGLGLGRSYGSVGSNLSELASKHSGPISDSLQAQ